MRLLDTYSLVWTFIMTASWGRLLPPGAPARRDDYLFGKFFGALANRYSARYSIVIKAKAPNRLVA
jgi:hypothetical protein